MAGAGRGGRGQLAREGGKSKSDLQSLLGKIKDFSLYYENKENLIKGIFEKK